MVFYLVHADKAAPETLIIFLKNSACITCHEDVFWRVLVVIFRTKKAVAIEEIHARRCSRASKCLVGYHETDRVLCASSRCPFAISALRKANTGHVSQPCFVTSPFDLEPAKFLFHNLPPIQPTYCVKLDPLISI